MRFMGSFFWYRSKLSGSAIAYFFFFLLFSRAMKNFVICYLNAAELWFSFQCYSSTGQYELHQRLWASIGFDLFVTLNNNRGPFSLGRNKSQLKCISTCLSSTKFRPSLRSRKFKFTRIFHLFITARILVLFLENIFFHFFCI